MRTNILGFLTSFLLDAAIVITSLKSRERAYDARRGRAQTTKKLKLLGFLVLGVLFAERAVLGNGKPVRIVTLILEAVVISVLAFCAL